MYHLLFYDYVENMLERRDPFRPGHLAYARGFVERGLLKMAGAYADTVDGAVFVFTTGDPAQVADFVAHDPYVQNGLVPSHRIRPWNVVIGGES